MGLSDPALCGDGDPSPLEQWLEGPSMYARSLAGDLIREVEVDEVQDLRLSPVILGQYANIGREQISTNIAAGADSATLFANIPPNQEHGTDSDASSDDEKSTEDIQQDHKLPHPIKSSGIRASQRTKLSGPPV